jgi:hypothetical protein
MNPSERDGRHGASARALALGAALCVACGAGTPRGPNELGLSPVTTGIDPDVLRAAVEAQVGSASQGAARVERVVRWRPRAAQPLVVWVTCRGSGDGRACVLSVGRITPAGVSVLGNEPVGWTVPSLSEMTADEVLISGNDGRGTWREQLRFLDERGGGVTFTRRFNDLGTF